MTVKFLISYSTRPLQMFGLLGLRDGRRWARVMLRVAGVRATASATSRSANRPLLLLGILLVVTGVQLVTLGLLAEMQARTYHESQDKPTYVIREIRETCPPDARR